MEDEVGVEFTRTCMGELRNAHTVLFKGLSLGRLDVDGNIILNWVLSR
jgi:hypothetical protein